MVKQQERVEKFFRSGERVTHCDGRGALVVRPGGFGAIIVRWNDGGVTEQVPASALTPVGKHQL